MSVEVTVHEGDDDPRIERVLTLIDEAARPRPLVEVLGVLCAEVAAIVDCQVASIYVREADALVLRANVGFPGAAIGQVRLAVGEGITGFAAECMRPVTVAAAPEDVHFKSVPGLGEEAYPIFLALPILVGRRAEAVLVLQRHDRHSFSADEILLATALATSFAYALERARARREGDAADESPRHALLRGRGVAGVAALGRVETVPTFEGLAVVARARGLAETVDQDVRVGRIADLQQALARSLRRTAEKLELPDETRGWVEALLMVFEDQILQKLLDEQTRAEPNPALALREVARAYARAPYLIGEPDPSSTQRSAEVEALCLQLALASVDQRMPSQGGVLLLSDRLPGILALTALAHRASALAMGGALDTDGALALCRASDLPVVDSVGGLFAWARSGDRLLVDAEHDFVHVNPSAADVAEFRQRTVE